MEFLYFPTKYQYQYQQQYQIKSNQIKFNIKFNININKFKQLPSSSTSFMLLLLFTGLIFKQIMKQIRSLPPGLDAEQEALFGLMWINIGTIKLIRTTNAAHRVLCQFWGESTPAFLSTRFDTLNNQVERMQKYNIKCPITFFAQYLEQMKSNLRLEVEDVGKVYLDISKFLKKNITIDSKYAFEHFKGFFQIIGKGNRKAGSLQIQMGCQFYPQVALQEIGESGFNEIREKERKNCPAEKMEIKECCGHCQCICAMKQQKKNKKTEEKKMVIEDDPRIAHSLNTKPRQESQFDPKKYEARQQPLGQKQEKRKVEKKKAEGTNQFPQVPKILTYSNLRLNYEDQQLKNLVHNQPNQSYFSQQDHIKQAPAQKLNGANSKDILNHIGNSVEDPHYEITSKPNITKEELLNQFYGVENSPFKSNLQAIKEKRQIRQDWEKDKLSRVINLDEELSQLKKLKPPPILGLEPRQRDIDTFIIKQNLRKLPAPKSNLMLTLFVEIDKDSVTLNTKQAFIIAYRPYGQKERLTLGPNFMESINIFSIVGETQIKKMSKTPLILQFWSATSNKFVGLVKIDLTRIKQGFILQDRLNEMAIKTNIHPTTVSKGIIKIMDLSDQQVGSCSIFVGIGTSNQINMYINQKPGIEEKNDRHKKQVRIVQSSSSVNLERQRAQKERGEKKKEREKIDENDGQNLKKEINQNSLLSEYDIFLAALYRNNSNIIQILNKLMNQRFINKKQFSQLTQNIAVSQFQNIFQFHFKLLNTTDNGLQKGRFTQRYIDFHQIADSFDLYIDMVGSVRKDHFTGASVMKSLIKHPEEVITRLKQLAPMNVISMKKALEAIERHTTYPGAVKDFMTKFNQYIKIQTISSILSRKEFQVEMKEVQLSQFNSNYINLMISKEIIGKLNKEEKGVDDLKNCFELSQGDAFSFVIRLLKMCPKIGLWGLLKWVFYFTKGKVIQFEDIQSNYMKLNEKKIQKERNQQELDLPRQRNSDNYEKGTQHIAISEKKDSINQQDPKGKENLKDDRQLIQPNQKESQVKLTVMKEDQKIQEKLQLPKIEKPNFYKYLFTINPIQITLENPIRGNCIVSYDFPFEEQQVKSKTFLTTTQKSKYPLKMYGTHGFSIQDSPQSYFSDNPLKFTVRIDKRIEYEGALPSDELLIEPNTEETKIIPLFSERKQGIGGKIKINISYEKIQASDGNLGKQTTYQLFLPKTGYINYYISCQAQTSKIRSQLNIKQEFYVAIVLDIFYHNSSMRAQFPPISSKLYSDLSINAELGGSIKLSLSANVLQYIKTSTGRLSLNIIYYSKQNGNFQRKQIPYAVIELPLISVIKAEGIRGDYAFKNKLGMFVSLAKCQLKYEKDNTTKTAVRDEANKNLYSYWLILNFLQFLNFESVKFSWVKMEFVIKGKKYSTDKIQLEPYSVNFLSKSAILVKFTEQEFADTKVIPVTIVTNTSEKLAIDINLKAMSKDAIVRKYSILSQYFIVVNQSSRATKMRVGLKSYCLRGGPLLSNFVNSLYQHLDTQIFDVIQYPQHVQNYEEVLQVFKNNLKLNKKALQEAMSELELSKSKQKLSFDFFTNRIYYKLDFTPILAANQSDIEFICQQLETQIDKKELVKYLEETGIKLQNFRQEFLDRYSFRELNKAKADKNVDFLGLSNQIDLISFVRKIKILEHTQQSITNKGNSIMEENLLQLTVLEGSSFQQLYNGIKPNCLIRIPQYGFQTQISHRNSNPYFNETYEISIQEQNFPVLRNLKFEAYHCTNDQEDMQNILIGEGSISINISQLKINAFRVIKVILNSVMSSKSKATINVKVGLIYERNGRNRQMSSQNMDQNVEQSGEASRLGEIIHGIRQQLAYKDKLFQSSDEDY